MIRLVKRYGSRKLYDTEESRYVGLEELAGWIRDGQEVRVVDNESGKDVTAQTLIQIISDQGRRGESFVPKEMLHEMIRRGEKMVQNGVEQVSSGMDKLLQRSLEKVGPLRRMREETFRLRQRLEDLERSLADLEKEPAGRKTARKSTASSDKKASKKSAAKKAKRKTASKARAGAGREAK